MSNFKPIEVTIPNLTEDPQVTISKEKYEALVNLASSVRMLLRSVDMHKHTAIVPALYIKHLEVHTNVINKTYGIN